MNHFLTLKKNISLRRLGVILLVTANILLFFYSMLVLITNEKKNIYSKVVNGFVVINSSSDAVRNITRKEIDISDKYLYVPAKRINMGKCKHIYGKVMIFVAVDTAYHKHYKVALDSLRCYIASTDYELKIVNIFNDTRVIEKCSKYISIFFRKHCAARIFLEETDWLLVMDADTGIVNPNHCIEEYIDDRVDMIFYERFFNWEIASGNYLVKNTNFSKDFLKRWADFDHLKKGSKWWNGYDNGAIHITALESILPKDSQEVKNCREIWYKSTDYETYIPYVICVRIYLGATRLWPRKFKLLRRVHSFCRDWYHTSDGWCEKDFMIHGWKAQHINESGWASPFLHDFDLSKCGSNYSGWPWRPKKRMNCSQLKPMVASSERDYSRALPKQFIVIPFVNQSDVGDCYPDCDIRERIHGL